VAKEVKSNADVARDADIVFLCVTGAPQVEEIVNGKDGIMSVARPGLIVVDTSTSERRPREDARGTRRQGRALRRRARSPHAGRGGAGAAQHHGRRRRRDVRGTEARPRRVLREHHPRRPARSRHRAEAHQQLHRQAIATATAEALAAAAKSGLSIRKLHEVISAGAVNSGIFQMMVARCSRATAT